MAGRGALGGPHSTTANLSPIGNEARVLTAHVPTPVKSGSRSTRSEDSHEKGEARHLPLVLGCADQSSQVEVQR